MIRLPPAPKPLSIPTVNMGHCTTYLVWLWTHLQKESIIKLLS